MSALDEITAKVSATRNSVDTAKSLADGALNEAQEKAQQAAALGVEGVAATVQAAHDALEAVVSSLGGAHDAVGNAAGGLREVTGRPGSKGAAERLAPVIGQLDQVVSALDTAAGSAEDAKGHAERAEIDSLTGVIVQVVDGIATTRKSAADAKSRAETYRQQVESLGN